MVATVNVGSEPWGVAYDSGKGDVFVANSNSNTVGVISDSSNTVVATVNVGSQPWGVTYDSGKGEVFVANNVANTVSVISDSSNTVAATVNVGSSPYDVAYDSGKGEVFVANQNSNNVNVISDSSNTVVATVKVGASPYGVTYDSGKGEVFVANWFSNNVSVISDSSNTVVATVNVGASPYGVTYDSGKGEVFVDDGSNTVSVISDSSNTVVATVSVGSEPWGVAYDSGKGEVFVDDGSNTVSVISDSSNTVVATVNVGTGPMAVAYDSGKGEVFVANYNSNNVSVIWDGTGPTISSFSASPNPIMAGHTTYLNVSASGGPGTFSYAYSGLPSGCSNADTSSLACTPTSATGSPFTIGVTVTDSVGATAQQNTILTVNLPPAPTIESFSASPPSVSVGQATTLVVVVSDGYGTLTYAYTGLPPGCASSDTSALPCVPTTATGSPFNVQVTVMDSADRTAQAHTSLTVTPGGTGQTLGAVSISPSSVSLGYDVNKTFTATATDTLGDPITSGVAFTWELSSSALGALNATSRAMVSLATGSSPATGTLTVTATSGTVVKTYSASISVSSNPSTPSITSFTVTPSSVAVGVRVTFQVIATGGTGVLTYHYIPLPQGCTPPASNVTVFSCAPTSAGTYNITATVTDQAKNTATSVVTLTVTGGQSGSNSTPFSFSSYLWIILVVVVLAAIVVAVVIRRSHKRGVEDTGDEGGYPPSSPEAPTTGPQDYWQPSPDYYSGYTFAQPPAEWEQEPSVSYGTYRAVPQSATPASEQAYPSEKSAPDAYKTWAIRVAEDGIHIGRVQPGSQPRVVDAQFTPETSEASKTPNSDALPPDAASAILQSLAQRPRSVDALKQVVSVSDDLLQGLLGAMTEASIVVHGVNSTTGQQVYALTQLGHKFVKGPATGTEAKAPSQAPPQASQRVPAKGGVVLERTIGPERSEENPFETIKPTDVNPNVQHFDPKLLQPMEMRVTQDRGEDVRDTAPQSTDAEAKARLLMEKAQQERERKRRNKFGFMQAKKPEDKNEEQ